ncbi:hypothetical protein [Streptomyces sp. NPDC059786]|uniref:hypothetical protein n=1 Tax=Streptomyces sp. NPDC059786 TaxID=3346946 RepID=UPI0036533406
MRDGSRTEAEGRLHRVWERLRDLNVVVLGPGKDISIDLDHCKGCGLCAAGARAGRSTSCRRNECEEISRRLFSSPDGLRRPHEAVRRLAEER